MKSYWIWNYGDYEIFHSNRVHTRRQEYGMEYPPFWRLYDVDRNVIFSLERDFPTDFDFTVRVRGIGYVLVDGKMFPTDRPVSVSAGHHLLQIRVMNLSGLPAAYVESDAICSDGQWYTLDPTLRKVYAGFEPQYDSPDSDPESFAFSYKPCAPVSAEEVDGGTLFDFGRELYGFLYLENADPADRLHVSYGESREEALDLPYAVVREEVSGQTSYKLRPRAFRYIYLPGVQGVRARAELEYLPLDRVASFRCDNEDVNRVWDMCVYTLRLNMREVLTEAIKRDRWLWGGDAYQAFKFVKYLCAGKETARRSLIALRGKEPFVEHINTITDYTLYWVIGLLEYYNDYADLDFVRQIYPRAVSLMDFCAGREDANGFIVKKYADWIFVDWSDLDKTGAVCAEQMLYIAACEAMAKLAALAGEDGAAYAEKASVLRERVNRFFWNEEKGAFIDSFESGLNKVTRHANVFAILYDIADDRQRERIVQNVLKNDAVTKITTPYFEGYELDVMGKLGDLGYIRDMLLSYWKGMLDLGATTVWEEFDPTLSGAAHYAMYGGKYQKSLCHAWGASPIYLLGKYFLGVRETAPGYASFEVSPQLGGFGFIEGTIPVRDGEVSVYLSGETLRVTATVPGGTLRFGGETRALVPGETVELALK